MLVEVPIKLNNEQKELLEAFKKSISKNENLPLTEKWFKSAKNFLKKFLMSINIVLCGASGRLGMEFFEGDEKLPFD